MTSREEKAEEKGETYGRAERERERRGSACVRSGLKTAHLLLTSNS